MKRFLSPSFFVIAAIAFLLPFVSVSCNPAAVGEGLEGFGGTESPITGPSPGAGFPGFPGGGGEVEIATGTGLDIALGSSVELEGLGGLGGLPQQPQGDQGSWGDMDGRLFVVIALIVAVAGLALSFLRGRLGGVLAGLLGIGGAALLVIFRIVASPNLGGAQEVPGADAFSLNFKVGWWLALGAFVLAAVTGTWVARTGTQPTTTAGVPPPGEPPPSTGQPPPPAPPPPPD